VNVHAVKNYRQMAVLSAETEFPSTFNFVPCLLEQIEDYVLLRADDPFQQAMESRPEDLTVHEVELLRVLLPGGPADRTIGLEALNSLFSPVDGPGRTREESLERRRTILRELLPSYRSLWERGVVELTTSAQNHPLLPLIIDLEAASGHDLPRRSFRRPEDADAQLMRGREVFTRFFERAPDGCWPSEGGVSAETAAAVRRQGFAYALTDENILWKSRPDGRRPMDRMKPYDCGGLKILFRDREISDLIGFEYQRWNERDAVSDLLERLASRSADAGEDGVTVIALDGENPWAGYRENGVPFLRELLTRLRHAPGIVPATLSRYLEHAPEGESVVPAPGTWLGSFAKWIGHPAKNRAWEALGLAREAAGLNDEILVAEGSDWFWWYGEPGTEAFDGLFRGYIQAACRRAGATPPELE
jgi:alpha-amylase/alpha-mannosidase (GH57 family)